MDTYRNGIRVEPAEGYNGWTNAETWHTKLVIDNDEGSYTYWREVAESELAYAVGQDSPEDAPYNLAQTLREEFDREAAEFTEGAPYWLAQYVRYGLDATNWQEIAEALLADGPGR